MTLQATKAGIVLGAGALALSGLLASSCSTTSPGKPSPTSTKLPTNTPTRTHTFTQTFTHTRTTTFTATITFTPSPTATGIYLYMNGGDGGASALSVAYSALVLGGGGLGTWVQTTSLPVATTNLAFTKAGSYCFAIGGSSGTSVFNNVRYSVMGGGALGPWMSASPLPTAVQLQGAAIANSSMWVWGGSNTGGGGEVWSALLSGNLPVGAWVNHGPVPTPFVSGHWGSDGTYLYHVGGTDTGTTPPVWDSSWSAWAGAGSLSWVAGPPIPTPVCYGNGIVVPTVGLFFSVSGSAITWAQNSDTTVYHAPISAGTIGTWATSASLPFGLAQPGLVSDLNYLYVLGGIQNDQTTGNSAFSGPVTSSGVSAWTALANLPYHVEMQGVAWR